MTLTIGEDESAKGEKTAPREENVLGAAVPEQLLRAAKVAQEQWMDSMQKRRAWGVRRAGEGGAASQDPRRQAGLPQYQEAGRQLASELR